MKKIVIGARGSKLSAAQAKWVADAISRAHPELTVETKYIKTKGDADQSAITGEGVFVKEIQNALISGEIDLAVHSLKDLPLEFPKGIGYRIITKREDAHDAVVSRRGISLSRLPAGSVVGTSSARRQAQILHKYPNLKVAPIRGNVDTRIRKVRDGEFDSLIVAYAALLRLGLENEAAEVLQFDVMLPAAGQGALAVEVRSGDVDALSAARAVCDETSELATGMERNFLDILGAGCRAPVGCYAKITEEEFTFDAAIASPDGKKIIRESAAGFMRDKEKIIGLLAERMLRAGGLGIIAEAERK